MAIATARIVGSRVFLADLVGDTIRFHIIISDAIKIVTQAKVEVRENERTGEQELQFYISGGEKSYSFVNLPVDQTADCINGVYFIEIV